MGYVEFMHTAWYNYNHKLRNQSNNRQITEKLFTLEAGSSWKKRSAILSLDKARKNRYRLDRIAIQSCQIVMVCYVINLWLISRLANLKP